MKTGKYSRRLHKLLSKTNFRSLNTPSDIKKVCDVIGISEFSVTRSIHTPGVIELKFYKVYLYSWLRKNKIKLATEYFKYQMPLIEWKIKTFPRPIKLFK